MTAPWLINKPASPSAYDDEFESDALDPKWTRQITSPALGYVSVRKLDPYFTGIGGLYYNESLNRHRPSWLMVQPSLQGEVLNGYVQTLVLPTDAFIYMRVSGNIRRASIADLDAEIGMKLYNNAVGLTDYFWVSRDTSAATTSGFCARNVGGAFTIMGLARNYLGEANPVEYIGIQKLGTAYHGWCAPESGNWCWLGSYTLATAQFDRVIVNVNNGLSTAPGRMFMGTDFFRVLENYRGPP